MACVFALGLFLAVLRSMNSTDTSKIRDLLWDGSSSSTGRAAAIRGSVSTADEEAKAIMQTNGMHFDEDTGVPFANHVEQRGSFDAASVHLFGVV